MDSFGSGDQSCLGTVNECLLIPFFYPLLDLIYTGTSFRKYPKAMELRASQALISSMDCLRMSTGVYFRTHVKSHP